MTENSSTVLVPNMFTASTRSYTVGPSSARVSARAMVTSVAMVTA